MTPITFDAQVKALKPREVIAYARKKGWQSVPHPNDNIAVFQGEADDSGQPIQLVLPKYSHLWDSPILLAKAINLLAEIEEKSPQEILAAIHSEKTSESSREFELTYRVKVNKDSEIIIDAAYTQAMGLKPGDEFEIQLGYKHIHLVQVKHQDKELSTVKLSARQLG